MAYTLKELTVDLLSPMPASKVARPVFTIKHAGILALSALLFFSCSSTSSADRPKADVDKTIEGSPVALAALPAIPTREREPMRDLDAKTLAAEMGWGINIGNTLENTTRWETGWGQPVITKAFIEGLAARGVKTVRLPVAWDTYAIDGIVQEDKMARVEEVVNWITGAGMYCVLNIHWDGGWIDSSWKDKFGPDVYATFSPVAAEKFERYWKQIAGRFNYKNELLVFEGLNEETNFSNEGDMEAAYRTLARVNQLFIDTVRDTGGNNATRVLLITGYHTDIEKTTSFAYVLPEDRLENKLLISVHYYTPWQFCGMTKDESWGVAMWDWGHKVDYYQLNDLFDKMQGFCEETGLPAVIGEFGVVSEKKDEAKIRWLEAVMEASLKRGMVPLLWDTGDHIKRAEPGVFSPVFDTVLDNIEAKGY